MASFLWRAGRALISPVSAVTRRTAFVTPTSTVLRSWLSAVVNPTACFPSITKSRFLPLIDSSSFTQDASKALVVHTFQLVRFYSSDKCKKHDKSKKKDKCKKHDKSKKKDKCKKHDKSKKKEKCKKPKKSKKCKKSKKKKCKKSKKRKSKKCKRTKKHKKGKKKRKCKHTPKKHEKPKKPCDVEFDLDMSEDGKRDECDLENEDPCERQRKIDKNPCVKRSKQKGKKCGHDICKKLKPKKGKGKKC